MKKFIIGLTALTSLSASAANLNIQNLNDVIGAGLLSEVRVTLDQQLTAVYQISKIVEKDLINKGLTRTTTQNLILRKIDMGKTGKIVSYDEAAGTVKVSFEKGCEEARCLYTFTYVNNGNILDFNNKQFVITAVPEIPGYTFVKANSGLLPFTDALQAVDKANLLINNKDILDVNKETEELGGYDSEESEEASAVKAQSEEKVGSMTIQPKAE